MGSMPPPPRKPGELPPLPPQNLPPNLRKRKICMHWEQGNCRRGADCGFAHGVDDLVPDEAEDIGKRPATTRMDFAGLDVGRQSRTVPISGECIGTLMAEGIRELLLQVTGVHDIAFDRSKKIATVTGTAAQLEKAEKQLQRVSAHCQWGASEAKVRGVISPRTDYKSVRLRLASMVPQLKDCTRTLDAGKPTLSIGSDPSNNVRVQGALVSRAHAVIEFIQEKGAVYVMDTSTNGTFLNGKRLPPKGTGKVLLWHGDELLLQDPLQGGMEFGYMVNLEMT